MPNLHLTHGFLRLRYMDERSNIHYLEVLLAMIQRTNKSYLDYNEDMEDEVIIQLAAKLKAMVHPSVSTTLKKLYAQRHGNRMFGRCSSRKTNSQTLGPPTPLDITKWVNSAVFVQTRWRSRLMKREFLQQLRKDGLMTPRLENLYFQTIPALCRREVERKKMRRANAMLSMKSMRSLRSATGD